MKILNIIWIIVYVLFISCKKERNKEETANFPQNLYANRLNIKSQFKLYTIDGEITNQTIKNRFKTSSHFYSLENQQLNPNEKMTFLSQDTAVFGTLTTKFSVVKNKNHFLFYSPTIVQGLSTDLIYEILKYKSEKVPVPSFNNFDYLTKEVRVANGSFYMLDFSVLSYLLKRGNYTIQSGTLFNEFNQDIISKLRVTDTLAIQEYIINFKAK